MIFDGWENAFRIVFLIGRIIISDVGKIFWGWGGRRWKNYFNPSLRRDCSALRKCPSAHRQATFTDFFAGSGGFASKLDCGADPERVSGWVGAELLLDPRDERDLGRGRGVAPPVVLRVFLNFDRLCGGAFADEHSVDCWGAP